MNNQLKLLLYIFFVAAIFYLVQNKFNLFDVKLINSESEDNTQPVESIAGENIKQEEYVEMYNVDQNVVRVNVEVANEEFERRLGLSGRKELGDYNGMLFVFDTEGGYPFWMKDMIIPLDMIFIDSQGFIVDIREGLEPCSADFCPNVVSDVPFKYVLEVNSGFVKSNRIGEGNSTILNLGSN